MMIVITGAVIASVISSGLLISALAVGKRGDVWPAAAQEQKPALAPKSPRTKTPRPRAGGR